MNSGFVAIARRKVTTEAIQQIMRLIASGKYRPGQQLPPERDLAEALGVSRPTLREVILALGALGVLETRHGRGTFVSSLNSEVMALPLAVLLDLNQEALRELFELRLILEVAAAEAAARHIGDTALAQLGDIRSREERAIDDIESFVDEDIAFHRVIHEASNNRLLLAIMDSLSVIGRQSRLLTAQHREVRESTLHEHQAIRQALMKRDAPAAAAAMQQHLAHVARALGSEQ